MRQVRIKWCQRSQENTDEFNMPNLNLCWQWVSLAGRKVHFVKLDASELWCNQIFHTPNKQLCKFTDKHIECGAEGFNPGPSMRKSSTS